MTALMQSQHAFDSTNVTALVAHAVVPTQMVLPPVHQLVFTVQQDNVRGSDLLQILQTKASALSSQTALLLHARNISVMPTSCPVALPCMYLLQALFNSKSACSCAVEAATFFLLQSCLKQTLAT